MLACTIASTIVDVFPVPGGPKMAYARGQLASRARTAEMAACCSGLGKRLSETPSTEGPGTGTGIGTGGPRGGACCCCSRDGSSSAGCRASSLCVKRSIAS